MRKIKYRGLKIVDDNINSLYPNLDRRHSLDILQEKSLLDDIFAPDPLTGNPNSEMFFRLSCDHSLRDYIDRNLLSVRISSVRTDDADFALDSIYDSSMRATDFADKLRELISKSV